MEGFIMRKVTGLLFLVCLVSGLMWGATDGKKYQDPMPMHPDTSAPDTWGYTWVKSTDPGGPTFNWVDISTRGTLVNGLTDDNVVGPFDMLWNFPYYWYSANRFKVGSNGYIQFDNTTTAFAPPFAAFPSTGLPNDLMAICVGDLVLSGQAGAGGTVRYWTNAVDSLVVSFVNVTEWESVIVPANIHTFQIILNKNDSSITYQYGRQVGRYNTTNNTRLAIGIENATGQIGLQYAFSTAPPHALMPDTGLAIKIKRTVNTGLQVTDAGIVGGLNATNLGEMASVGVAKTIQCVVKNFGTAAITNAPVRYAITRTGQPSAFDTVIVPSLAPSQQVTVTFPRQFTPAVTGAYSALFNVTVPSDVGPGNNNKTAEITSASFTIGQNTVVQYETGVVSSYINWIGGGGMAAAFDLPASAYPVRIESVYVSVGLVTAQPMTVEILDGSTGSPGTVLATRTVSTTIVGMNGIDVRSDSIRIPAGRRFFVGARGQLGFNYEITAPISYRSWEYTGGWAPYRSGDLQDIIIRASVQPYTPPAPSCNTFARTWAATGAFPNLPAPTYFQASAWLGDTLFVHAPVTGAGSTTIYKYLLGGGWSTGVPLPGTKVGGTLTKAGNKLYYIGGGATAINGTASAEVLEFDPTTQAWTLKAPLPVGVAAHGAVSWGDSIIFVVGGPYTGSGTNLDVQYYRIATNTWGTIAASLPTGAGRRTFACGISGNKIVISGGFNTAFLKSTYVGTINSASSITWAAAPDIPTAYAGLSRPGGVAYGDKFFVINGERAGAGGYYDTTHVFTVSSNSWTHIISGKPYKMSNICNAAAAKCVNDTIRIFVPGGYGSLTGAVPGVETNLFDVINGGSLTGVPEPVAGIPTEFELAQNYPNPFNPSTTIQFGLPVAADVTLKIYNVLGQEVVTLFDGQRGAGTFQSVWNGRNSAGNQIASGMYFYNLVAKSADGKSTFTNIKKMLFLK
jgi:hypothetical protein